MSIPVHQSITDYTNETTHHEPQKSTALMPIFVLLLILATAAIFVGFTVTGPGKVWVSLTISAVQAATLAYFFMDLRHGDRLTWLSVGAAGFWVAILFVITLTDYFTRQYWAH